MHTRACVAYIFREAAKERLNVRRGGERKNVIFLESSLSHCAPPKLFLGDLYTFPSFDACFSLREIEHVYVYTRFSFIDCSNIICLYVGRRIKILEYYLV